VSAGRIGVAAERLYVDGYCAYRLSAVDDTENAAFARQRADLGDGHTQAGGGNDMAHADYARGVAAGWEKWWPTIEDGAQHVNDHLVDLAGVAPGKRVLDIATGIGEPALSAAKRVGSAGQVVATDISAQMLDIARIRATTAGVTKAEFLEADAERLDFPAHSFDAILCRWGITSLPDYSNLLLRIERMLTPNGLFATSVWDEASRLPSSASPAPSHRRFFSYRHPDRNRPPKCRTTRWKA
jgi:ubiquinone/menaquinone biosynthesis C-methylase UbiE